MPVDNSMDETLNEYDDCYDRIIVSWGDDRNRRKMGIDRGSSLKIPL